MNNNYRNGAVKERRIMNKFREQGCIAFRSAGSHSPIDVCVINSATKEVLLIQSKVGYLAPGKKAKILSEGEKLNGDYKVKFELWCK